MMRIDITTKQLCHMLEEAYKNGVAHALAGEVSPKSQHATVEEIIIAHLRNSE